MDLKVLQKAKALESKMNELVELIEKIEGILSQKIYSSSIYLNGYLQLEIPEEHAFQITSEYLDSKQKELRNIKRELSEL